MYETAKSLEIVEVEVYGCFIFFSYLLLHKTLILRNKVLKKNLSFGSYISVIFKLNLSSNTFFLAIYSFVLNPFTSIISLVLSL